MDEMKTDMSGGRSYRRGYGGGDFQLFSTEISPLSFPLGKICLAAQPINRVISSIIFKEKPSSYQYRCRGPFDLADALAYASEFKPAGY